MGNSEEFINHLFGVLQTDPVKLVTENMDSILKDIEARHTNESEEVRGLLNYQVDEMSLCFADDKTLLAFISGMVRRGWVLFNQDEDEVVTRPLPSSYTAQYWFLRHMEREYRFEMLLITDGHSPYHYSQTLAANGFPWLAHASFQLPNEAAYANAVRVLRDAGYEALQHCTSNYGRFSYFTSEEGHVIKPRLNTRDGSGSSGN